MTLKIVLVEDDADVLLGTKQALELAGFSVEPHDNAEAAVDKDCTRCSSRDRLRCQVAGHGWSCIVVAREVG